MATTGYLLSESAAKRIAGLLKATPTKPAPKKPGKFHETSHANTIVKNDSGEEIPAYAIMQPNGVVDDADKGVPVVEVIQWDGTYPGPFLFNSHNPVPEDENGMAQFGDVVRILYATGYSPTAGDTVGPVSGEWHVNQNSIAVVSIFGILDEAVLLAYGKLIASRDGILFKAPSGGIPQAVGTLLGTANCDVWDLGTSARNREDSGVNIDVLNPWPDAVCVNGDRMGEALPWYNSTWLFVQEYCSDELEGFAPGTASPTGRSITEIIFDGPYTPGYASATGVQALSDSAFEVGA